MARVTGLIKDQRRLGWLLSGLWLALLIPTLLLGYQVYQQLRFESMHQYRASAETMAERISVQVQNALATEELRPLGDYWYSFDGSEISPLAAATAASATSSVPGMIGYFRLDADGAFGSPRVPSTSPRGVSSVGRVLPNAELNSRLAVQEQLQEILRSADARVTTAAEPLPIPAVAESVTTDVMSDERREADKAEAAPAVADVGVDDVDRAVATVQSRKQQLDQQSNQVLFEKLSRSRSSGKKAPAPSAPTAAAEELSLDTAYYDQSKPAISKFGGARRDSGGTGEGALASKPKADLRRAKVDTADGELASRIASEKKSISTIALQRSASAKEEATGKAIDAAKDAGKDAADLNSSRPAERRIGLDQNMPTDARTSSMVELEDSALAAGLFTDEFMRLEMVPLTEDRLLFFRRAFVQGQRMVQGFILDQRAFLQGTVAEVYAAGPLAAIGDLSVALDGRPQFSVAATAQPGADYSLSRGSRSAVSGGELLYRRSLPAPLDSMELLFSARELPVATGSSLVLWSLGVLLGLLCAGFVLLYLLGKRQLQQRQQQQDFISAVSHELKTPLTSIRMYGEMLKSGWVTEDKRTEYYDYIYSESERLSRLISNVLQLSKISRGQLEMALTAMTVGEILDLVESRTEAQVNSAGFELVREADPELLSEQVLVERDAMVQVMINLIDNAVKFSASADTKVVAMSVRQVDQELVFSVRDYGPGVAKDQLRKIFDLFYRSEEELTRETLGTGIGLALVRQLVTSMGGSVSARNLEPGAQFQVRLPVHQPAVADGG